MVDKINKIQVVVVLGHIDHGKSSLLEAIRKDFQITKKESGGITQHIGAYEAEYDGKKITFIDTPGHEAFSEMRSRGAKIADIAILVVAADEGVKPQTKEAIEIIKKSKIPTIVALNKTDRESAEPEKVKRELQNEGVLIEDWGGDVPTVLVSAKTGKGKKDLLSMINLLAEVSGLKVSKKAKPKGFILESHLDSFCGPTASLILEEGKLKNGDIIKTDTTYGKIKSMQDYVLQNKEEAMPGEVIVITGLKEVPGVGESFVFADSIEKACQEVDNKTPEEYIFEVQKEDIEKYLKVVLKADFRGSLEVVSKILKDLVQDKIGIKILKADVGDITDSDTRVADKEEAVIIGFRVKTTPIAQGQARQREIKILIFDVIYDMIDNIRKEMEGIKEKRKERVDLGKMKPLVIFKTQKRGEKNYRQIVGGKIIEGELKKGELEIKRGDKVLTGGKIIELQEQKKKIEKAKTPQEIGILYEGKTKIKEGDTLLIYEIIEV